MHTYVSIQCELTFLSLRSSVDLGSFFKTNCLRKYYSTLKTKFQILLLSYQKVWREVNSVSVCVRVYMCVYMCVHVYVCACTHVYVCACVRVYVCVWVCMCICVWVCMCTCVLACWGEIRWMRVYAHSQARQRHFQQFCKWISRSQLFQWRVLESKEANLGSPLSTGSDGRGSLSFHFVEMFGWLGPGSRGCGEAAELTVSVLLTSFPYRVRLVYLFVIE